MINYFKKFLYLYVFIGTSVCLAGSYEDFFNAIRQNKVPAVEALLRRGFDPNTVDPDGKPGLVVAIEQTSFSVAAALARHPLTVVETRNAHDESPLMLASLKGALDLCQVLIGRDADINKTGWTPLHYAATGGHLSVMGLLLERHAYIDASSPNGTTPLMMAAMYGSPQAVKLLLDQGADAGLTNSLGMTASDFAEKAGRLDAKALIAAAQGAR